MVDDKKTIKNGRRDQTKSGNGHRPSDDVRIWLRETKVGRKSQVASPV